MVRSVAAAVCAETIDPALAAVNALKLAAPRSIDVAPGKVKAEPAPDEYFR